ncbi:MAG: TIR domain-containing protein [Undibacterium sp.]|nr:TIR domain-containing protein [Opitutaceae bacterium]
MSESPATPAVFISYAREDAAAARSIAGALRGFGIEVWFDQDELRGGDAWDQKILGQIRGCTLLLAVISGRTQERAEGYFRREWKLAAERTHDMAAGIPFLVPVVIDDTAESAALVPDEFMRVQWTRLPGGRTTPQFAAQVKRLLEAPRGVARSAVAGVADPGPALARPATVKVGRRVPAAAWIGGALAVAVVVLVWRRAPESAPNAGAGTRPLTTENPAPAASAKSLAVLPFENFSPDAENAFFADGMHDEVITALSKIHDLTVISRTSVMAFRKTEGRNLRKIAADLGVASVLEGSVQRAGGKVKVIVQLIDARTDRHLWAETYIEELSDVFTIQSKLAGAITAALKATLSPAEQSLIARRPTQNQEAYDLYLRARALFGATDGLDSRENLERTAALCDQAIAKDPAFALAYVQLCFTHSRLYWFGHLDPTPARRALAKAAQDAAVRLAPDAPETRLAVGYYIYAGENDWVRALEEFRAAAAGLPNDAQVPYFIALSHRRLGRLTEALASFARALELNPRDQASAIEQVMTSVVLRRYAEARELAGRYVPQFPNSSRLLIYAATAQLEFDRDYGAYLRRLESAPPAGNDPLGLAKVYSLALARGDLAAAERALADPRLATIPATGEGINEPVALHRALVAFLRGNRDAARPLADQALADFAAGQWTRRQEAPVLLGRAAAHALAGRSDEALRLAREGTALHLAHDKFTAFITRTDLARLYVVLDRREEALAVLREMMTDPSLLSPEQVRHDPLWSRLKDDPRFEEMLKAAKAL